jgi:pyruvate,water dikinase
MSTDPAQEDARGPGFPSPFEVAIPPDCEGWEEMYAYHMLFAEERREPDERRFWFQDGVHGAEPLYPFESLWIECAIVALNQANARMFVVPPSLGIELRILCGYYYFSANSVTDPAELGRRAELFAQRGVHYYQHWDEIYGRWCEKIEAATRELAELEVPELPELEDLAAVTETRGVGSSHTLLLAYDRLLQGFDRVWQYHFELLNLGYGAYLVFYEHCRAVFPGISDQAVARMVSGIDVLVLRPDEELRRLARRAHEVGIGAAVKDARDECELRAALSAKTAGKEWLADFDATKDPWFYFSFGNGLAHDHGSWLDDTAIPIRTIGWYVALLEAGAEIGRPHEEVAAERDRITTEYRMLLSADARAAFDDHLRLCRTVFPFVENHNFYIEHRWLTIFWNKLRGFGVLLARAGFLDDVDDLFFLRHDELREALEELRMFWSSGGAGTPRGPGHWPPVVGRRKAIHAAMRKWSPPPALGTVPGEITEPQASMLFGITPARVRSWLGTGEDGDALTGVAGSPGVVEGTARVVLHPDQLGELEPGEILVAASTSTSWTPVFGRIAGAVLDTGGIMCHAAIVAREYELPAVVGVGTATTRIKTGDRLRVDANTGVVTVL